MLGLMDFDQNKYGLGDNFFAFNNDIFKFKLIKKVQTSV